MKITINNILTNPSLLFAYNNSFKDNVLTEGKTAEVQASQSHKELPSLLEKLIRFIY